VTVKGKLWFLAKDVYEALSYGSSAESALRKLDEDEDEKLIRKVSASSQTRQMWFVNASGLYNLIFLSSKPEARQFRKWVTSEMLPSIRKFRFYIHPSAKLDAVLLLIADDKSKVAKPDEG
jgi:prophage antirepressor-like protein